jgi:hypothetical protein
MIPPFVCIGMFCSCNNYCFKGLVVAKMAFQANCKCKNNCALHKVLTWPKYNVQGIVTKPQISDSNLDSIWHQFHDEEMSLTSVTHFGLHVV